ncbi:MAG: aminoacyl-tRNA hydrolase [Elusimicrobia bacterium RIFOXYB2_FULL_48_7]|nr:MAG: aminoacyl-tRNA hydrolase [Elusimicrobia bacterium RIFOXYB2_FULL_48_7]
MRLIVGLGNPGSEFELTRHNLGFTVVDRIAQSKGLKFRTSSSLESEIAALPARLEPKKAFLLKPRSFMNLSGVPVQKALKKYSIKPEEMLLVYDDYSLPLGKLRIRMRGSSGGHNGVESVIIHAGTQDFPRLRLGIGPLPNGTSDSKNFVLSRFKPAEKPVVKEMTDFAADAVQEMMDSGNISVIIEKINNFTSKNAGL